MRHPSLLSVFVLAGLCISSSVFAGPDPLSVPGRRAPRVDTPLDQKPFAVVDGKQVPVPDIKMGDAATIERIAEQGKYFSGVMATLTELCNTFGPRLTGSEAHEKAATWARDRFRSYGLKAELWQWGTIPVRFDRGPSTGVVYRIDESPDEEGTKISEPQKVRDLQFTTLAWAAGTNGPTKGRVIRMPTTENEYKAVEGQLKGAWILLKPPPTRGQRGVRGNSRGRYEQRIKAHQEVREGKNADELPIETRVCFKGIAGFISTSKDERVWTGAISGWRDLDPTKPESWPSDVEVTVRQSDYDFINSRITDGDNMDVEFNLANKLTAGPFPSYLVIAELPGTTRPDEVVIMSGHLDSWNGPGSQGTTDDGTGSAVTIETARILTAARARPDRTIRFVLWCGEEQGLLGSKAYVESIKDQLDKVSACFVDDGGTNYQGGLPAADNQVEYLSVATAPVNAYFPDMTVNVRPTGQYIATHGSSDHASFNAAGTPGFFWDEVGRADYGYGWHTQNDRLDLAIPEYLIQSATCSAITTYNLACAPELLPRAEKAPKPTPRSDRTSNEAPKPDAKAEPKAEAKPDAKPDPKLEAKPESK